MTLIAGIVCQDGVVFAADSASSDTTAQTKQPYEKIRRLGQHRILYAGSGDVGLLQKIDEALNGFPQRDRLRRICQELKVRIVPEQREAVKFHSPYPAQGFNVPPEAVFLFAGISEGRPWLLEIEKDGRDTAYDQTMGNFAAIGSGKPWAQATFRPYLRTARDLRLGTILAYRVLDDAIALSMAFLAPPIHIWKIPVEGDPSEVSAEEMAQLKDLREVWRIMEVEILGQLEPKAAPVPEHEPELPEPNQAAPPAPAGETGHG